jgi:molecular chaperone GrpE (heat shock protein)
MTVPLEQHYDTLGVAPDASEEELRRAYRALAQRHHPDHNAGSPEAARRFEQIHAAYAAILRARAAAAHERAASEHEQQQAAAIAARVAELERELQAARRARERRAAKLRRLARRQSSAPRDPALAELSGLIEGLERLASSLDRATGPERENH